MDQCQTLTSKSLRKKWQGVEKFVFYIVITIITLVSVIMLAAVTEIDNVTRGSGRTISEVQNKLVIFRARNKNDGISTGDAVRAGDVLST